MGLKMIWNPHNLEAKMLQEGEKVTKGLAAKMRERARLIRDLARAYAPHDTGALEEAIDYEVVRDGRRRQSFVIYINLDKIRSTGEAVGTYAYIVNSRMRPYGTGSPAMHLGPGSRAKGAGVGGLFLTRAIRDGMKGFSQDVARVTSRSASRTIRLNYVREIHHEGEE